MMLKVGDVVKIKSNIARNGKSKEGKIPFIPSMKRHIGIITNVKMVVTWKSCCGATEICYKLDLPEYKYNQNGGPYWSIDWLEKINWQDITI